MNQRPFAHFRIFLGILIGWQYTELISSQLLRSEYLEPAFHFPYPGLHWLTPLPAPWMHALLVGLILASTCFALGYKYKYAAIIQAMGYGYILFLDQTQFLQQYYLLFLLSFLMIWIPAHRELSIDAIFKKGIPESTPWHLRIIQFQIAVVYIYAGIGKINADWLAGEPIRTWLPNQSALCIWVIVWGGILFNLLIIPLLLHRKTNMIGRFLVYVFHITNAITFHIAIFPWLMLVATLLFFRKEDCLQNTVHNATRNIPTAKHISLFMMSYIALQILLPLRPYLYGTNPSWTEEGRRFSWQMMLRYKETAFAMYTQDPATKEKLQIDLHRYLSPSQITVMQRDPHLTAQFARWISNGRAVYANVSIAMNGHPEALIIDPTIDLSQTKRTILHANWILDQEK